MTLKELAEAINQLTPEQQELPATTWDSLSQSLAEVSSLQVSRAIEFYSFNQRKDINGDVVVIS